MTKALLLSVSLLAISILAGCGGDDAIEEETAPPAAFVRAIPPSGLTITFDNAPADVTVRTGTAVPSGKTGPVNGPFTPASLNLKVTWADGTQALTYTVTGLH